MSAKQDKYMWLLCFFDLPVTTKPERRSATQFRNFLLKDGYMMLQFSVYARICNGQERVEKHLKRVEQALPKSGSVRLLQITDKQYGRMKILLGKRIVNEEKGSNQLVLF